MRPVVSNFVALAAIALLAGCGGSGSPPSAAQPPSHAGGVPVTQNGKTRASVTVVIGPSTSSKKANAKHSQATGRNRDYIAPTTQGIIAEFSGSDSTSDVTYQGYTLSAGAAESSASPASCGAADPSDGSYTCTLYFALTPNITYAATLTAYDAAQSGSSGQPVDGSHAVSTGTQNITIAANTANTFSFTLSGIVEGFSISPQYVGVAGTSSGTGTLTGLFQALDADNNPIDQYDGSTAFSYGSQPSGPFSAASFPVVASDENETCTASTDAKKRAKRRAQEPSTSPCLTTTSTAVMDPASETVSYAYNGDGYGGDGTTTNPPYYGEIALTPPTNYAGFNSSGNAASLFIVPFFGFVDSASTYTSGTASVAFTASGQTITGYATQYHPPSAAPADGSGYTVDATSCGAIASVGPPSYTPGVGISFTITAGSTAGTCSLTLSDDGSVAGADTTTISISNAVAAPNPSPNPSPSASFVAPQLVQSNTGIGTVSLPNNVTAGDTLVLTISNFDQTSNNFPTTYGNFSVFAAAEDSYTSFYLADVTASGALSSFDLGGPTTDGGTVYWIGEFSGTSSAAITSANSAINGMAGSTVTVVPNAPEGLLIASSEGGENSSFAGYQQFTESSSALSEIQVELAQNPTTDTTDPVTISFAGADADSESAIQIAPAAFSGTQGMMRRRSFTPAALQRHLLRMRKP